MPGRPLRAFLLLVPLAGAAQAQIYKCPDPAGRVVLQQMPCEGGTQLRQKPAPSPTPPPNQTAAPDADSPPAPDRAAINRAIVGGYPVRGMNLKELEQAMKAPTRINASDYASGYREQRIYQRPGGTFYVYTRDGIVDAVQFTESIRPASPPTATRICPTPLEIRNAEVSANSIALSDDQRRDKLDEVKRMRECR